MTDKNTRFTASHEWARLDSKTGEISVGITAFAAEHLGDIVFLELPTAKKSVIKGASFGTIESVKSASDIYSPVSGEITAINEALPDDLEGLSADPYGKGWMIRIKPASLADFNALMDETQYNEYLKTQE